MTKCAVCVYGFDSETSTRGRCGVLATVELKDGNAFRYKDKRRKWEDSRIDFSAAVVTSKEDIKIMLHSRKYNQSRALAEKTTIFFIPNIKNYILSGWNISYTDSLHTPAVRSCISRSPLFLETNWWSGRHNKWATAVQELVNHTWYMVSNVAINHHQTSPSPTRLHN